MIFGFLNQVWTILLLRLVHYCWWLWDATNEIKGWIVLWRVESNTCKGIYLWITLLLIIVQVVRLEGRLIFMMTLLCLGIGIRDIGVIHHVQLPEDVVQVVWRLRLIIGLKTSKYRVLYCNRLLHWLVNSSIFESAQVCKQIVTLTWSNHLTRIQTATWSVVGRTLWLSYWKGSCA